MTLVHSLALSTLTLAAATSELDDCVVIFGLPKDATVAQCREAAFARMANGERACGQTPDPAMAPEIRARNLEAEAARLGALYRARRLALGFNAAAEAIQEKLLEKIDDGAQAGRSWSRFLAVQAALKPHLDREVKVGDVFTDHSAADHLENLSGLEDLVSVPEMEEV